MDATPDLNAKPTQGAKDNAIAAQLTRHESRFAAFGENAVEGIWRIDFDPPVSLDAPKPLQIQQVFERGIYTEANDAAASIYGLAKGEQVIGKPLREFMNEADRENKRTMAVFVRNRFHMRNLITYERNSKGETLCIVNNITPGIQNNRVLFIWGASLDITELQLLQEKLEISRKELDAQKRTLEEKNAALKALIAHIEMDKKDFKQRVAANIDQLILPSLDKIRMNEGYDAQLEHVRRALLDLTSSFGLKVADSRVKLTPREIEVCNLVKNGLSSKEIARVLKIALHTVEKHRRTARKKLGLTSKGINLQTYLNSL